MNILAAVYNTIRNQKRIRKEMSVRSWIRHADRTGASGSERDIKEAMRYLESRGFGTYVPGRYDHRCRFRWNGGAEYVRSALSQEIGNAQETKVPDFDVRQLVRQLEKLVRESEKIVVKINAALAREGSSLAHVHASASGADRVVTSLTSFLRTPTGGCFTARDVHALNPQVSVASVRIALNQMVVGGELEAVDVKSGRVGRPVKLFAWPFAKAA